MLAELITAAALVLAPVAAPVAPERGPEIVDGIVNNKWYESSSPRGLLQMPTGPECWNLHLLARQGTRNVCVTREAWHAAGLFTRYHGPAWSR